MDKTSRREFVKKSTLGAAAITVGGVGFSARSYRRIIGSNDRLTVALVGCGRRVRAYFDPLVKNRENTTVAYVCDVMKERRDTVAAEIAEKLGYSPVSENDFRKALADERVDAIFNATPDHWHAPGTWMALEAGKHVYIEKPLTHNPEEAELLIRFQKKSGKVIQMGNQQRSAPDSIQIIGEIHNGVIGEPYLAVAFYTNQRGRVKNPTPAAIPEGLDWDLFQGPAPRVPYHDNYFDYDWHWFWNWGTGETGNNATHEVDVGRWALEVDFPEKVIVNAGKYHVPDDGWTMYDTMDASFIFPGGKIIRWDGKSRNNYKTYGADRGTIIYGSEGSVYVDRGIYKLYDRSGKLIKDSRSELAEAGTALGGGGDMTTLHVENFFDAIRGKTKPKSPVDEGAKSTHMCHLANIAYRTGKELVCDPENGHILDEEAMKLWGRTYEPGWEPKT
jgi:predicted dehydrogenase